MIMNKIFICLLIVAGVLTGCTRYENPQPYFEEYEKETTDGSIQRKVLIVVVDGLVGLELKKDVPANLTAMMAKGKYSFEALADENTSDPASWATLATGVNATRHRIITESYIPAPDPLNPHRETPSAASFLYMIKQQNKRMLTTVVTQSRDLSHILLLDAKETLVEENDQAVKTAAVEKLKDANLDLMLTQFTSVLNAGKSSSFSYDSPAYKSAIAQVDGFIGELKTAVESRATYDKEDWLIIVTSTHGAVGNSYGGSSPEERNIFMLYYNKNFGGQELNAQSIYAPRFFGYNTTDNNPTNAMRARNTTAPAGESSYNVAETGELTIEAKIKVNKNPSGNYSYQIPPFLSKTNARSGNTAGWSFFRSGNNVAFYVADGGAKIEITANDIGNNEIWSQMTVVVTRVDGVPTAKFYVNGTLAASGSGNLNIANINSSSPLTFGFQPETFAGSFPNAHNNIDFYMADVRIWNVALTDKEIEDNVLAGVGVPENHPKIANLVGYWPLDDGDNIFRNKVSGKPNIPTVGPAEYRIFGNNMPSVDPRKSVLLKSQDLPTQVLYWLELSVNDDWQLEGNNFLKYFEIEFIK